MNSQSNSGMQGAAYKEVEIEPEYDCTAVPRDYHAGVDVPWLLYCVKLLGLHSNRLNPVTVKCSLV